MYMDMVAGLETFMGEGGGGGVSVPYMYICL